MIYLYHSVHLIYLTYFLGKGKNKHNGQKDGNKGSQHHPPKGGSGASSSSSSAVPVVTPDASSFEYLCTLMCQDLDYWHAKTIVYALASARFDDFDMKGRFAGPGKQAGGVQPAPPLVSRDELGAVSKDVVDSCNFPFLFLLLGRAAARLLMWNECCVQLDKGRPFFLSSLHPLP
jgi:hypothetical protein